MKELPKKKIIDETLREVNDAFEKSNLKSFSAWPDRDLGIGAREDNKWDKVFFIEEMHEIIERSKKAEAKLLAALIIAIVTDKSLENSEIRKKLRLILSADFEVEIQEEKNSKERKTNLFRAEGSMHRYDNSLLYLPLSISLNEKYGEAGIFLGKVAAMAMTHTALRSSAYLSGDMLHAAEDFTGQEKLREILGEYNIDPFSEITLLEVGGSWIGKQPLAGMLRLYDSVDINYEGYDLAGIFKIPRDKFLLLDTMDSFIKRNDIIGKYKFVVASRVLESGSRIARAGLEGEERLIASSFAAMADLTAKGGYLMHRTMSRDFADDNILGTGPKTAKLHDRLGIHGDDRELFLKRDMDGRFISNVRMFYKYKDVDRITQKELYDLVPDKPKPGLYRY